MHDNLTFVLEYCEIKNIKRLLSPENVNTKDIDGYTPLLNVLCYDKTYLCDTTCSGVKRKKYKFKEVLKILLKKGADVNARTRKGQGALSLAWEYKHDKEVVKLLMDAVGRS